MKETCYCGVEIYVDENECFEVETDNPHFCAEMQKQMDEQMPHACANNNCDRDAIGNMKYCDRCMAEGDSFLMRGM